VAETARVLVETERLLLEAAERNGFPATILRLAGIYGPGRGYWLKQYLNGQATIEGTGGRILNMVHRDDVVGAILAALQGGRTGEVYNVVDDEPTSQLALYRWLAEQSGGALPPPVPENADSARKRGLTNKRVSNRKLKEELGYQLKYPSFREGYAALNYFSPRGCGPGNRRDT
jgi:nucleoside-diphosphate-sugar epimerase